MIDLKKRNNRILALDYGDRRIGAALTDETNTIASPLQAYTMKYNEDFDAVKHFVDLCFAKKVGTIVIGLPKNMNNTMGERVIKTKRFAGKLKSHLVDNKLDVTIEFVDERLTSMESEKIMKQNKIKQADMKKFVDGMSASIILQTYLSMKKPT